MADDKELSEYGQKPTRVHLDRVSIEIVTDEQLEEFARAVGANAKVTVTFENDGEEGEISEHKWMGDGDYLNPDWKNVSDFGDWRSYINDELREIWCSFTPRQKRSIADNAQELVSRDSWRIST